jgi:hypothetical protein
VGKQAEMHDWEQTIVSYQDNPSAVNCLKLAELNLALAETGRLADDVFHYTQVGQDGLLPDWDRSLATGALASDIFYSMGLIAFSQRMAFEAYVVDEAKYNPAMIRRLIQTNIILGAYPVAEKYIAFLEKEGYDCSRFKPLLYNDAAVEADVELGPKRHCVPVEDHIALERGIEEDLKQVIRQNPSYHRAIGYLGVIYLLNCKMEDFKLLLDEFYGTGALPALPGSFAEAACMLSEVERNYWKDVGVPQETFNRYRDFKKRLGTGLPMDKFKDTFWYYIMRVNSQFGETESN